MTHVTFKERFNEFSLYFNDQVILLDGASRHRYLVTKPGSKYRESQGAPCSENQEQIVIEVFRDNINGITKACYLSIGSQRFRERINGLIYEETHGVLMIILQND
ncbi:hypothetical protein R6Q59_030735 [Mikania micrantha]